LRAPANSGARREEIADHADRYAWALLRNCFGPGVDNGVDLGTDLFDTIVKRWRKD
jgi:hypothetical protein